MRILVVGATSAIAEATARRWAARGDSLYLAARREPLLEAIAADLRVRGAPSVGHERFDAGDLAAHEAMLERAAAFLGGLDVVLVAHGSLPDPQAAWTDAELAARELHLNGVATAALVLRVARRLEAAGAGVIAVVTSVAGVRGRASNGVYGAAKAMVSTLLSGLRQRLSRRGVAVVDVRPGFVDTPMTRDFRKGPLWASPARVARDIERAIDRRDSVVYTPWFWRWILLAVRHVPEALFVRIRL